MPASYRGRGVIGVYWQVNATLETEEGTHGQAVCLQAPTASQGQLHPAPSGDSGDIEEMQAEQLATACCPSLGLQNSPETPGLE